MILIYRFLKLIEKKNKILLLVFTIIFLTVYTIHYFINAEMTNPFIYFRF